MFRNDPWPGPYRCPDVVPRTIRGDTFVTKSCAIHHQSTTITIITIESGYYHHSSANLKVKAVASSQLDQMFPIGVTIIYTAVVSIYCKIAVRISFMTSADFESIVFIERMLYFMRTAPW